MQLLQELVADLSKTDLPSQQQHWVLFSVLEAFMHCKRFLKVRITAEDTKNGCDTYASPPGNATTSCWVGSHSDFSIATWTNVAILVCPVIGRVAFKVSA